MIHEVKGDLVSGIFVGWDSSMILSCLEGIMGHLYADDSTAPQSCMAFIGDFRFFDGRPDKQLVQMLPLDAYMILIARKPEWFPLFEQQFGNRAARITRYAFRHDTGFDCARLMQIETGIDNRFELREIDADLYEQCRQHDWSRDFVSLFGSYEAFRRLGIGVAALDGDRMVSGASSYVRYSDGIEIEVDTDPAMRRHGLAAACAARLIRLCLNRGLTPRWDAHTAISATLAKKLGFLMSGPYTAFEINAEECKKQEDAACGTDNH